MVTDNNVLEEFTSAFEAALDRCSSVNDWDKEQKQLLEHHPMCDIVNEERYYEDDSSCDSGRRVYVTTTYVCNGRTIRRKKNYCT